MGSRPDSEQASQQAKEQLERAKSEAGHLASSAADAARRRGREGLDRVKDQTANRAEEFADAIDATADDLESSTRGGEVVSDYGHSMASMMRRLAGGLREKEIEEFADQLAGFARRSPGTFLAGSVALGFGLSRFLKATSQRPADFYQSDEEDYSFDEDQDEYLFEPEEDIDTSLQPAASPEVSSYSAGDRWPEDEGRERPGAGSPTQHTSPAAEPPSSEYSRGATGEPAASSGNLQGTTPSPLQGESHIRGDESRRDNLGRDNLGGSDRE